MFFIILYILTKIYFYIVGELMFWSTIYIEYIQKQVHNFPTFLCPSIDVSSKILEFEFKYINEME